MMSSTLQQPSATSISTCSTDMSGMLADLIAGGSSKENTADFVYHLLDEKEKGSVYQALHDKAFSPEGVIFSSMLSNILHILSATTPDTLPGNAILDRIAKIETAKLNDALRDLHNARDEAREEGFPQPSDQALQNAKRLLIEMYAISPRRFEVYPTPDSEIAIDAPDGQGRSVILLCDSEGGALCLVNMNGNHRRARYATTETLPDGFMREALADLQPQSMFSLWRSPTTLP